MSALAVIAGDGIGPEVTAQALRILESVKEHFKWDFQENFQERPRILQGNL